MFGAPSSAQAQFLPCPPPPALLLLLVVVLFLFLAFLPGPPADFYGNGLNFLAYMDMRAMPKDEKVAWGVDLALSALIGDKIFSFGKVLENKITLELAGTPHAWLIELLTSFHRGDVAAFNACIAKNEAAFKATMLSSDENVETLKHKIVLLAVVELVFSRDPDKVGRDLADLAALVLCFSLPFVARVSTDQELTVFRFLCSLGRTAAHSHLRRGRRSHGHRA